MFEQNPGGFLVGAGEAIQEMCAEKLNLKSLGSAYFVLSLLGEAIIKLGTEMEGEVWVKAERDTTN